MLELKTSVFSVYCVVEHIAETNGYIVVMECRKDQVVYATEKDLKTFRTALGEMLAKLIVTMTESLTDLQELHFRPDALQLKYGKCNLNQG